MPQDSATTPQMWKEEREEGRGVKKGGERNRNIHGNLIAGRGGNMRKKMKGLLVFVILIAM